MEKNTVVVLLDPLHDLEIEFTKERAQFYLRPINRPRSKFGPSIPMSELKDTLKEIENIWGKLT